MSNTELIPTAP